MDETDVDIVEQIAELVKQVPTWLSDIEAVNIWVVAGVAFGVLLMLRFAIGRWEPRERPPRRKRGSDDE